MRRGVVFLAIVVLLICYGATIRGMAEQWWSDEDMGHGFVVPLVAIWIIWRERERWRDLPLRGSPAGWALLVTGAAFHLAGAVGGGLFMESLGFVISIAGLVVVFGGFALLRAWAFPLALLVFMLPKLAIVYNQATLPLQLLATRLAAAMLSSVGFAVVREGNILDVTGHRISVVEACNGIRYLLPLAFLALVFAYLAGSGMSTRLAMLAAAIPVAIGANALRVAISGLSPALAEGVPHMITGAVIFVLCLAALATLHRMFSSLHARLA